MVNTLLPHFQRQTFNFHFFRERGSSYLPPPPPIPTSYNRSDITPVHCLYRVARVCLVSKWRGCEIEGIYYRSDIDCRSTVLIYPLPRPRVLLVPRARVRPMPMPISFITYKGKRGLSSKSLISLRLLGLAFNNRIFIPMISVGYTIF